MAPWDFEQIAGVLGSLGMAEAADEPLDIAVLVAARGEDVGVTGDVVALVKAQRARPPARRRNRSSLARTK